MSSTQSRRSSSEPTHLSLPTQSLDRASTMDEGTPFLDSTDVTIGNDKPNPRPVVPSFGLPASSTMTASIPPTPRASTSPAASSSSSSSLNSSSALIAIGVLSAVLGIFILITLGWCCYKRKGLFKRKVKGDAFLLFESVKRRKQDKHSRIHPSTAPEKDKKRTSLVDIKDWGNVLDSVYQDKSYGNQDIICNRVELPDYHHVNIEKKQAPMMLPEVKKESIGFLDEFKKLLPNIRFSSYGPSLYPTKVEKNLITSGVAVNFLPISSLKSVPLDQLPDKPKSDSIKITQTEPTPPLSKSVNISIPTPAAVLTRPKIRVPPASNPLSTTVQKPPTMAETVKTMGHKVIIPTKASPQPTAPPKKPVQIPPAAPKMPCPQVAIPIVQQPENSHVQDVQEHVEPDQIQYDNEEQLLETLAQYCGQTYVASYHHVPDMEDELEVCIGDYILLEDAYADG